MSRDKPVLRGRYYLAYAAGTAAMSLVVILDILLLRDIIFDSFRMGLFSFGLIGVLALFMTFWKQRLLTRQERQQVEIGKG